MSVAVFRKAQLREVIGQKRLDFIEVTFHLSAGLGTVEVVVTSDERDAVLVRHQGRTHRLRTNQQPNVMYWTYPWFLNLAANAPADMATVTKPRDACSFALIRFAENAAARVLKAVGEGSL